MTPRTPRRSLGAEPFVTLSLTKPAASRLSLNQVNGIAVGDQFPHTSDEKIKPNAARKTSNPRSASKAVHVAQSKNVITSSPAVNPEASLAGNTVLSLKFKTLAPNQSTKHDAGMDVTSLADPKGQSQSRVVNNADHFPGEDPVGRRSSTASLTDTTTRTSHRARKLTTKAQALAGTNFLPSLQTTSDAESLPSPTTIVMSDDSPTGDRQDKKQRLARQSPSEGTAEDALIESVETSAIRSSTRERKPTTRAMESETSKISRKRPASPANSDRASKVAKGSPTALPTPSKLRHSVGNQEVPLTVVPEVVPAEEEERLTVDVSMQDNIRTTESCQDIMKEEVFPPITVHHEPEEGQNPSAEEETTVHYSKERVELPPCDLECLSPVSRLLAYAQLAADWPDVYNDDTEDDYPCTDPFVDIILSEEYNELMNRRRPQYCKCQEKGLDFSKSRDKVQQDASNNVARVYDSEESDEFAEYPCRALKPLRKKSRQSKRQTSSRIAKRQEPTPLRQSSSFEQQMSPNDSAVQHKKPDIAARISSTSLQPPPVHVSVGTVAISEPSIAKFPAQPIRFQVNGSTNEHDRIDKSNDSPNHPDQTSSTKLVPSVHGQTLKTAVQSNSHARTSKPKSVMKSALTPAEDRVNAKSLDKAGRAIGKEGEKPSNGKSSAAGSVRRKMHDAPVAGKESAIKQYQAFASPPATSIKLRFTTNLK